MPLAKRSKTDCYMIYLSDKPVSIFLYLRHDALLPLVNVLGQLLQRALILRQPTDELNRLGG